MKKTIRIAILTCVAALATIAAPANAQHYVNVLFGGFCGFFFLFGVVLSQLYGQAMPNAKVSVQAAKASLENLNMLQAGRGEGAFSMGDTLSNAWKGNAEAGFKTPLKKLRTIAVLYTFYIHVFSSADSGIMTLSYLKGKRVSFVEPNSGNMFFAHEIFMAAGLSFSDFA